MAQDLDLFIQTVPFNPVMDKGADTTYGLQLRDAAQNTLDLRGYTAVLTIYPYQKAKAVYDTLSSDAEKDALQRIKTPDETGVLWVTFPKETTAGYKWTKGWYKLELISAGGAVTRICDGSVQMRD